MLSEIVESTRRFEGRNPFDLFVIEPGNDITMPASTGTCLVVGLDATVSLGDPDTPHLYARGTLDGMIGGEGFAGRAEQAPLLILSYASRFGGNNLSRIDAHAPGNYVADGFLTNSPALCGEYYHGAGFGLRDQVPLSNPFRHLGGVWLAEDDLILLPLSGEGNFFVAAADDEETRRQVAIGRPYLVERGTPFRILSPVANTAISFLVIGEHRRLRR